MKTLVALSFHLFGNFTALVKESVGTGNGIVVFMSYTWPNSQSIHFASKCDLLFTLVDTAVKRTFFFYLVL